MKKSNYELDEIEVLTNKMINKIKWTFYGVFFLIAASTITAVYYM